MKNSPLSIYIHWPFCKSKCPYCDFNSHVRKGALEEEKWVTAYLYNIEKFQNIIKTRKIHSIFFGGGTPSLMPLTIVERILHQLNQYSSIENCEITLEANPTSFEKEKFRELKNIGINRLSIGIQSLNDNNLKFLGREHSAKEAEDTINEANKIFDNYSIDLIYSLPKQTITTWETELKQALNLAKHHISLYQLTIEKGTKFFTLFKNKEFTLPNENTERELYIMTQEITKKHNFYNYETSNFAQHNKESKHNLAYWKYQEYLGIGPGAHSRVKIGQNYKAFNAIYEPNKWLSLTLQKANNIQKSSNLSIEDIAKEYSLMGLRLTEGLDLKSFHKRFNANLFDFLNQEKIDFFKKENLLTHSNDRIYLSTQGKLLVNYILQQIII